MIQVKPVSPLIGAEISGVDLSNDLSADLVSELRDIWLRSLVIVFRGQRLTPQQLVKVAKCFGPIGHYPFVAGMTDVPEIVEVIKRKNETINFGGLWHTDTAYLERPPMASLLYAVEVPPVGGDTLFANMYAAYDSLSGGMKSLIGGLKGVNSSEKPEAAMTRTQRMAEKPAPHAHGSPITSHPIVRTHPETGRKALYCSDAHVTHFEGFSRSESRPFLQHLYAVQQRPEFGCRLRWREGTLALWDNRCTQHNALNDYQGHRRVMHRITLEGDIPI